MFEKKNRVYIFDWDDNIVGMPTTIKMEKETIDGKWELVDLGTEEYAKYRKSPHYRYSSHIPNPYVNFEDDYQFLKDLTRAIETNSIAPSFAKFKEAMIYGHDFSIITARGHTPQIFMFGIVMLIGRLFSPDELIHMKERVGDINKYLNRQEIWPVSSEYFANHYPHLNNLSCPTEIRKSAVMNDYVSRMVEMKKSYDEIDVSAKLSIGFSDDDTNNVLAIEELVEKVITEKHPEIHFVLYDTSDPKNVIKKVMA